MLNHQNNFGTNLTSNTNAGDTTSPLNSIPTIAAPFSIAFDATNINGHYETKTITSKTATNVLHSALTYAHTTSEEVRIVVDSSELDGLDTGWKTIPATLTFSSADAPIFVCTTSIDLTSAIGVGMKIKLTHGGSEKKFFVHAIDATTITLYGGTDFTLSATAITLPYYSQVKAPVGFPLDPTKWTVEVSDTTTRSQASPTQNAWYNLGSVSISIPIGIWKVNYMLYLAADIDSAINITAKATLSTANNSESDVDLTTRVTGGGATGTIAVGSSVYKEKSISAASKTSYYINTCTTTGSASFIYNANATSKLIIRAVCAYL